MLSSFVLALLLQVQNPSLSSPPPKLDDAEQGEKDKEKAPPPPQSPTSLEVAGNKITFYGILRMDSYYGTGRFNHTQFTYYANSPSPAITPGTNDHHNWIDMTPRLSRFGVKVNRESLPFWKEAKVDGVFEFDFQNRATSETSGLESESRELPRLRHAYVKLQAGGFSFLAGQTWDLISPLWPVANADGMMWNSGNLGDRRPQLRLGYDIPISDEALFTTAIAAARTGAIDRQNLDPFGDTMRDGDASGRPMVQGRIGLAKLFGKRVDAGIWGHYGWERTESPIGASARTRFYTGSVGYDLKAKIIDELTFAGEIWYGKNLSDLRGGIDQGVNTVTGVEIASRGGWAELVAQLADPYFVAVGVGVDDPRNSSLRGVAATNTAQRVHNIAPYVWNKVDFGGGFAIGAEAIFWSTDYLTLETGRANRYSLFVTYSF